MWNFLANLVTSKYGRVASILLWVIVPILIYVFSPSLTDVSVSRQQDFLPSGSESTKAIEVQTQYFPTSGIPGTLVYKRDAGLTQEDYGAIREDFVWLQSRIDDKRSILGSVNSVFNYPALKDILVSADDTTLMIFFSVASNGDWSGEQVQEEVRMIRGHIVEPRVDGLEVWLTGPTGVIEDALSVFQSIDFRITVFAILLVLVILLAIYRAPLLAICSLLPAGLSFLAASGIVALLADRAGLVVNSQATSIMVVLIFGAGTDYMLFISSRFREQLKAGLSVSDSISRTMSAVAPAIFSSAVTTILAMLMLSFATLRSFQVLGPVLALGMGLAILAGLTFIPALLSLIGRRLYWPGKVEHLPISKMEYGFWYRAATWVRGRPLFTVISLVLMLLVMSVGVFSIKPSFDLLDSLPSSAESVEGYEVIKESFPSGSFSPTYVYASFKQNPIDSLGDIELVTAELAGIEGVSRVSSPSRPFGTRLGMSMDEYVNSIYKLPPHVTDAILTNGSSSLEHLMLSGDLLPEYGQAAAHFTASNEFISKFGDVVKMEVVLQGDPGDLENLDRIAILREHLTNIKPPSIQEIFVGGNSAIQYDTKVATARDIRVITPIVLLIILIVLMILLRAILAPLYLLGSVVISFLGSLGISAVIFQNILGHEGIGSGVPMFMFLFLVALGVDYNIYIISRVREEAKLYGIRDGTVKAVSTTGGVITSAGIILAGTFGALTTMPLRDLFQLGFVVSLGVMIDTFLVRGFMVPAFVHLFGRWNWWPFMEKAKDFSEESAGSNRSITT